MHPILKQMEIVEIWKPIPDYEGRYEVSNFGRVKSLPKMQLGAKGIKRYYKGRIMRLSNAGSGYPSCIIFHKDGNSTRILVHRIVGFCFVQGYSDGLEINHKDGDKLNNHYSNLEWVSRRDNLLHAIDSGLRRKFSIELIRFLFTYTGDLRALGKEIGVSESAIHSIRSRRTNSKHTLDLKRSK